MWENEEASSQQQTILKYIKEIGCCTRCTLRLMGEKNYTVFFSLDKLSAKLESFNDKTNGDQKLSEEAEETPPSKKALINNCICCCGALQQGIADDVIEKMKNGVKESGHEFESFVLRLTLPPTIELRENLLLHHLEEKFGNVYTSKICNDIATVREVWKWTLGPHIGRTFLADFNPFSDFSVSVFYNQIDFELECKPLEKLCPVAFPNRNRKKKSIQELYSRNSVLKALDDIDFDQLKKHYSFPPEPPTYGIAFSEVVCKQDSIYLAGRYNKYSRKLSQTPWFIEGEKKMENSVEELICGVIEKHIIVNKIVFSSSGREDVDVRMLGTGRPFVLELFNPRKITFTKEEFSKMQQDINTGSSDIEVRHLQRIDKDQLKILKEGEEFKKKTYSALCCLKRPITASDINTLASITNLEIQQKTPIRVLHRRTLSIRPRTIHSMSAEILSENTFRLIAVTQAGTYVKEFVHGDFGRTVPNIGTILKTEADIMELDVTEIEIDWPPKVD